MLPLHEVFVLIAPAGGLVLAVVLLALRINDRANRAFALYVVLEAVRVVCVVLGRTGTGPDAGALWLRLVPYFGFASFFALLYFVAVFPRPRRWLPRRGPTWLPFAIGAVAVELLYVLDRTSIDDPSSPLGVWIQVSRAALWVVPFVLARDWVRDPPSPRARTALWFSLGLVVQSAYFWTVGNTTLVLQDAPWGFARSLRLAQTGAALAVGAYVALVALRRPGPDVRRPAGRYVAVLTLAVATAALVGAMPAVLGFPASGSDAERLVRAVGLGAWNLVLPVVVTYSLLRLQLFDIDLRLKRTVKHSTVAAAFIILYVAVTASTQVLAPAAAPYLGLGAALLLLAAIVPLQRLADRVADAAMPGVGSPGALIEGRLDVYRAALEQAVAQDGSVSEDASSMLATLRRQLGITQRDHAVMQHMIRRAGTRVVTGIALPQGGLVLGRYRVREELGHGAFGRTYMAFDETLRRQVVLKVLSPGEGREDDVLREAQAIAAVRHPNVVTIYDVERVGDQAVIVMEYVEGGSLAGRLERGPLPPAEFAAVAHDTLQGLGAVHAASLVHRDVKPSNILLARDGTAKIADFGIARLHGAEATVGLSSGGPALGTARYMSPEQARGRRCTARSDLFSAAATLFEAWTGRPYLEPRADESAVELQLRAATQRGFRAPLRGPAELRAWFTKALQVDAAKRFGSAEAMVAALPSMLATPGRSTEANGPRR